MKKFIITAASLFCMITGYAQSIISEQKAFYDQYHYSNESDWDKLQEQISALKFTQVPRADFASKGSACSLTGRRVYGWHPYWNGSNTHANYQWNLLSDLCYFDYTIMPATGANSNVSFAWNTSSAVTAAKTNGVKISFCATLFSSHSAFLSSSIAKNTFIQNAITLLKARGGTGVCIDFESMPVTQRSNLVSFLQALSQKIHDSIPGGEVALSLPAVDWNGVFDIPNLKNSVDLFIIMGYDYYYGGSSNAGPADPLYPFETSYNYGLSRSISFYLDQGVPKEKLLLGIPYYGRQYQTAGNNIPSANTGGSSAASTPVYKTVRGNSSGDYSILNKREDLNSYSPYFVFQNSGLWYQCFMNDAFSLSKRYDIVNQRGLAGIGIWALGYDDGYTELWNAISDKLTSCYSQPCTDSLFDMGGPGRNYNDKESYVYTISPPTASNIILKFSQFDLEANYDSLWLYNGPNITSPLIGSYTGTNSPGIVHSTGTSLTIRFKSDGATTKAGYKAVYTCQPTDTIPPKTSIPLPSWSTGNFTANFNDTDIGTGIQHRFYSAEEYTTAYGWRANKMNGFYNDAFDGTAIHTDWTKQSGTWTINSNTLYQSDQFNTNSNLSAALSQNSDQVLYHWTQKIGGTGSNRRGGLHFMCSAATGNGRGNSYLVYMRADGGGKLQIYKYVNDMMYLYADISYPFAANTTYDVKVIYSRSTGEIAVFINSFFAASWTDMSPILSGSYVCFRSGECLMNIDDFEVLKNRAGNTMSVSVGSGNSNDIRSQNPSPGVPSGKIKSIVLDGMNLLSASAFSMINIDYTSPVPVGVVRDGLGVADIATVPYTGQLSANWNASGDEHSGITAYWYAIGTSPGATDVTDWTDNGTATFVTKPGLISLNGKSTYYFSVKAQNRAGLQSMAVNSNGQKVVSSTSVETSLIKDTIPANASASSNSIVKAFKVYPDPANTRFNVTYTLAVNAIVILGLFDLSGREVERVVNNEIQQEGTYSYEYDIDRSVPKGIYQLVLRTNKEVHVFKVMVQ